MSSGKWLCLCDTLTGCVVNPLNMCRRIFLKISKDVLRAHVIDTGHVDCLQTQPGYSLKQQKSKQRNLRYRKDLRNNSRFKERLSASYLSSSCPYPAERCAACCSPPHRSGNVALASLFVQWPPDKYNCTTFQQTCFSLTTLHSIVGICEADSGVLKGFETFLGSKWINFQLLSSASHKMKNDIGVESESKTSL